MIKRHFILVTCSLVSTYLAILNSCNQLTELSLQQLTMSVNNRELATLFASLGPTTTYGNGSGWNPHGGTSKCVWVTLAKTLDMTVPQLEDFTDTNAPRTDSSGADELRIEQLLDSLAVRGCHVSYPAGLVGYNQACGYKRGDETDHCVTVETRHISFFREATDSRLLPTQHSRGKCQL